MTAVLVTCPRCKKEWVYEVPEELAEEVAGSELECKECWR